MTAKPRAAVAAAMITAAAIAATTATVLSWCI